MNPVIFFVLYDMYWPVELLCEIAKWNGVAYAKLYACSIGIRQELTRRHRDGWRHLIASRVEYDGVLVCCEDYRPIMIKRKVVDRALFMSSNRILQNLSYRLFKKYNGGYVLMLMIEIRVIIFRNVISHNVSVNRRDANGIMQSMVGELRHNITDEYDLCMQLFDEYAIEMYGCKLTHDILYNNT